MRTQFRVTRRGITVRVHVLPTERDVTAAYCAAGPNGIASTAAQLARGETVRGFTVARKRGRCAHITLPLTGWTPGLVAHEVTHVAGIFGHCNAGDDEPMAYFVGDMVDSICTRMQRLEARYAR